MDAKPGDKAYALLIFLPSDHPGMRLELDLETASFVADADVLFADPKHLAELTWLSVADRVEVNGSQRLVLATTPDPAPNVSNSEKKTALQWRVHHAWRAALLVERDIPLHGQGLIFTGMCSGRANHADVRLQNISGLARESAVIRPFYASRQAYWEKRLKVHTGDTIAAWLATWQRFHRLLCELIRSERMPRILQVALTSQEAAMSRRELEFRIPDLVRAAECILALPRGRVGKLFAERALRIAPELSSHWYFGGPQVEHDLRALYDLRSECVHGKIPFEELQQAGEAGAERAARLECLAMELARRAIVVALEDRAAHDALRNRSALESAWACGAFPHSRWEWLE